MHDGKLCFSDYDVPIGYIPTFHLSHGSKTFDDGAESVRLTHLENFPSVNSCIYLFHWLYYKVRLCAELVKYANVLRQCST